MGFRDLIADFTKVLTKCPSPVIHQYKFRTIADDNHRETIPTRVPLAPNEVMHITKIEIGAQRISESTGATTTNIGVALSHSDLDPETGQTDTSTMETFLNRPDFVFGSAFRILMRTAAGQIVPEKRVYNFDPPICLPRGPTWVLLGQALGNNDDINVDMHLYYFKSGAATGVIIKLMKLYKSFKSATVPRTIDE